jgi:type III secretion protein J
MSSQHFPRGFRLSGPRFSQRACMKNLISAAWSTPSRLCFKHLGLAAVLLSFLTLAGCQGELYTNLDEKQANEIVATLLQNYIPAERVSMKGNLFAVRVDEGRFAEAVSVLKENGLPRDHFASIGEVFKRDGMFISPAAEKASMIYALSQELAHSVSDIRGVLKARVHLVLPENDPLRQQTTPSSASVVLQYDDSIKIAEAVPQIKQMVANGVSGLTYDKVSVALFPVTVKKPDAAALERREMTSILGIWVHSNSLSNLAAIIVGLVVIIALLIGGLVMVYARNSKRVYRLNALADARRS